MDTLVLTIIIATLPVFILLGYFHKRDKGEKEPWRLMKKVFWWGIAVTLPIAVIELALDLVYITILPNKNALYFFISAFFLISLPEELGKLWVVKTKVYKHKKFNEIMDGITYCILASLGFAIFENILYTLQYGIEVGVLRAFTAVPAHALFSGIMGYYIGLAKFAKDKKTEKKRIKHGLIAGVFFHGLYDFLLLSGQFYIMLLVFPLLAYMGAILNRSIRWANAGIKKDIKYF